MNEPGVAYVLGVDGGGTSTSAIVARTDSDGDSEFIARGFSGPSNPHSVGWDAALVSISEAVNQAAQTAGVSRFDSGCFSIAGCGRATEQARLMDWLEQRDIADTMVAVDDGHAVLRAGTPGGVGIAVIAGTGSLVFGRNQSGHAVRAGGWGYLLGDEGSGFAIGLDALKAVAAATDGVGAPTQLSDLVLTACDLQDSSDVIPWLYGGTIDRAAVAALAPIVFEAATDRDEVALSILWRQLHGLERQIRTVANRLNLSDSEYHIALAGGVLTGSELYRSRLLAELQIPFDRMGIVDEPAQGAALIAADLHD